MTTKTKQWTDGSSATIQYGGQGDGQIIITSDPNEHYEARSMQITVETADGSGIQRAITVNQAAKQRIDISTAVVTAATQTYNGSAKTPTPTVTLNGSTVPSTGYDIAYSNNTNAGTATIIVTGKGDYTGTATGTFTINKATPSYTAPATRSLTYSGSSQYLTTSGSTSHGTIYYSKDGSNWYTSRRTGTNAGTYYCYWKLVGDSNHTDISSTYLGTTSIAKASRSISWNSYPSSLNVGQSGSLSASVSAGSGDGTISYSSSNSSKASVSGSTVTAVSRGSCTIYASISEGTNYLSASTSYTISILGKVVDGTWSSWDIWPWNNSYDFALITKKVNISAGKTYYLNGTGSCANANKIGTLFVAYDDGVTFEELESRLFTGSPTLDITIKDVSNTANIQFTNDNRKYLLIYNWVDTSKAQKLGYASRTEFRNAPFTLELYHYE